MVRSEADRESTMVARMIRDFASEASSYLMPRISFVGQDSKLAEELKEDLSWLTLLKEFEANESEIYILKNIPENFLEVESGLSPNTGLIVITDTTRPYPERVRRALERRIAATLHNPRLEDVMWTIRATLLLKEASYTAGEGVKLFSVDTDFRHMMSQCIKSIVRGESIVISSEDACELELVKSFLLTPMPYAIRPRELVQIEDLGGRRNNNKYMTLTCTGSEIEGVWNYLTSNMSNAVQGKKVIIFHNGVKLRHSSRCGMKIYNIIPLSQRNADRSLTALMQAMEESHTAQRAQIGSKEGRESAELMNDVEALMKLYRRMSLDALIAETESTVLLELKEKAGSVKAAVAAAGISQPTYYKKISRYKEAKSVLGISRNK